MSSEEIPAEESQSLHIQVQSDSKDGFGSLCLSQTFLPFTQKGHKLLPPVMPVLTAHTLCSKTDLWGKSIRVVPGEFSQAD